MPGPVFDEDFREKLFDLSKWRRDVRHFKSDPVDEQIILDCLEEATHAPSVGNSQPWRFVVVEDVAKRAKLAEYFEIENERALKSYSTERAAKYAKLKLAGIKDAPVQITVFADTQTNVGYQLGSQTMPQAKIYSVVAAIQVLWFLLRSYGVGLGWVSILPPEKMVELMEVDPTWTFVGHLCIGYPKFETDVPELVQMKWQDRLDFDKFYIRR